MPGFHDQLTECLPALWRYAFALTRDRAAADDLVQDCAERALRKRYLWLPHRPLKPWLMKMLLNTHRNAAQSAALRRTEPLDDITLPPANTASAENRLELIETLQAIDTLPAAQREALLVVVLGGLDYKQAARTLGIPQGTLMSRLSRARARLREMHDTTPTRARTKPAHVRSIT